MSYSLDFNLKFNWFIANSPVSEKEHQKDGIRWMYDNETGKKKKFINGNETIYLPRGGLLADEMGLGKTTVMIGTMVQKYSTKTMMMILWVLCAKMTSTKRLLKAGWIHLLQVSNVIY